MASVAICPHCYLQLVVPDGVVPDERVECPTCAKEFGIDQAVVRAIPEVVRRKHATGEAVTAESVPENTNIEAPRPAEVEEVVEVDELPADAAEPAGADILEQIKARIDREIAGGNLLPGMSASLSLETPSGLDDLASQPLAESELLDEWHRPTVRVHDLTSGEDTTLADHDSADKEVTAEEVVETDERAIETNKDVEISDAAVEPVVSESGSLAGYIVDADATLEHELAEQSHNELPAADELVSNSVEPSAEPSEVRPAAKTLADLMPPISYEPSTEELADLPGPSFELPNVSLTPPNSATVEFDPSMTFGPAAESEFELDQVDFESSPIEDQTSEFATDSPDEFVTETNEDSTEGYTESDEPVFREPSAGPIPETPFVLPGIPRPRKKRSAVRTLVGAGLGGFVGLAIGYGVLMFLLGPEGDLLNVAQYLPSAVLPKSFQAAPAPVVAHAQPPQENKSENIPAAFTEEVQPEDNTAVEEPASDERYAEEPSPLDEPTAQPITNATSAAAAEPLPIHGPDITVEELATALEAGKMAQTGLMTGDLSDAAVRRTKGMSYAKLCDLAEALTFLDRSSPSVESEQASADAERLFRDTLSDAHTREEVDRIATIWIDSPHRQHGGVFLAGVLSGGEITGSVYEYDLTTDDGAKLTLLAAEPLDPAVEGSQRPVGIVGSIVAHASDVAGYDGTADRAIWVTQAIPLE